MHTCTGHTNTCIHVLKMEMATNMEASIFSMFKMHVPCFWSHLRAWVALFLLFLHNLLRSRAYRYPFSSVSGQFDPVFHHVSSSYLQLMLTLLFLSLPHASQNLLFLLSQFICLYLYKAIFHWFLQLKRCLFIIIFKHLDRTVFTIRRIYLVGLALFKKVRILCVNPSSGKVTSFFFVISFLFIFSF